ncbi:hypothetical protein CB0940_10113 [Cercospora beticola]|uniref:BTB domain-containing protein n=1 Tax=Cercospora beticola TaxID=122368 RepID=A0A2G5HV11_CERBT|nr:hypothetical protein CB0940_10113 [Cercospora beticola]PIA96379.1 hypothetical protein CB0940_10113 [Cercospora beticola]WPB06816.1 hypothetical protein RHO25_011476 [Cercospora beticola]CAK1366729.1 unnamed protein product [Cercospora beticola]
MTTPPSAQWHRRFDGLFGRTVTPSTKKHQREAMSTPSKRKHDQVDQTEPNKSMLRRMYESGEWSDLTIEAANGRLFKVHKSVVCLASPYFNAACTAGFRETHTNRVKLPEGGKVVDAILRHFYEIPAPWTLPAPNGQPGTTLPASEGYNLIELRIAIDKYGIPSLVASVEGAFGVLVQSLQRRYAADALVTIGRRLFEEDGDFLDKMRQQVVAFTAMIIPKIFQSNYSFQTLHGNATYLRKTILHKHGLSLESIDH